jgi:hypothetical protein
MVDLDAAAFMTLGGLEPNYDHGMVARAVN